MDITENFYNQIVKDLKDNIIKRYCVYYNNDIDCWYGNSMWYDYEEGFTPTIDIDPEIKEPKTYLNKKLKDWFYLSKLQKKLLENEYYYCTPSDQKIISQNGSYFDVINIKQYCLKYNINYYSKLHPIFFQKWADDLYWTLNGFPDNELEEKFNKLKEENDFLYPPKKEEKKKITKTTSERSKLTAGLRYDIFRRDNFRCQICGRSAQDEGVVLHVDHIIPVSKGGKTEWNNLRTLCQDCNLGKSNKIE